jgi:hypothetical protein
MAAALAGLVATGPTTGAVHNQDGWSASGLGHLHRTTGGLH